MRARPQRLHQTLGEAPHLTPGRAPDSQRSRCENEVAVVSAVGLHLPQTRAFQLQPDHQLATQPGACRKASAPRHLAEVPASATVWKVRPQTLRWAGECGAAWGCGGKAGSFGGASANHPEAPSMWSERLPQEPGAQTLLWTRTASPGLCHQRPVGC